LRSYKRLALIAAVCGSLASIGTFLPWVTVDIPMMRLSRAGISTLKGPFVLIAALTGASVALLVGSGKPKRILGLDDRQTLWIALGCMVVAFVLTSIQLVSGDHRQLEGGEVAIRHGTGLWLDLVTTLGGSVAAFLAVRREPGSRPIRR
jgi:hypothetical protein